MVFNGVWCLDLDDFVKMIGLSQWRAVVGLWNHCKIRLVNPRVNPRPLSNTARSPFDIESGDCCEDYCSPSCSLSRIPHPDPPIICFSSVVLKEDDEVQDDSLSKRSLVTVSGDTICRLVTLMFYFLFLLLLSGDVELNPGPITVEQGNSIEAVF